ncbi:MAG: PAS domain S-box protein, partial [Thermoplasmata archaeon]|nr:PAS domain S-box protein [Thermoplasmata archaeon]
MSDARGEACLRLLVVEDDPNDAVLIDRELCRGFPDVAITLVDDESGYSDALAAGGFDIVITDLNLPWTDGLRVLREVRERYPFCPVIMFTGTGSEETAVEAMKAGLDDYVLKRTTTFDRLNAAIHSALVRLQDRSDAIDTEGRYRRLFDRVPIGLYRTTPDGVFIDANPAMVEMLGYKRLEDLIATRAAQTYLDPADRAHWQELMDGAGTVKDFHARVKRRDGIVLSVEDNSRAVRDHFGHVICYEGSLTDVTERVEIKRALEQSEEMFRGITEHSLLGVAILQGEVIRYVNRAGAAIVGHDVGELLALGPGEYARFIHPEDRAFVIEQTEGRRAGEGGAVHHCTYRLLSRDGDVRWVEQFSAMTTFGDGPADLITMVDVTDRVSAEDALKKSVRQWVGTFDAINDGVSLLDAGGTVIQSNIATSVILGMHFTQIIGARAWDLVRGEWSGDGSLVDRARASGEREVGTVRMGNRWLMVTIDPILDDSRSVSGFVFIVSDITSQRRAEERLLASLTEKEVLLKEVHHRVKNNMQIISSMLNLQAGLVQGGTMRGILLESQTRIRTMALIHEKLYQSDDLSTIDVGDYLRTLTRGLQSMYGGDDQRVRVSVDIEDVALGIDHAIPVG